VHHPFRLGKNRVVQSLQYVPLRAALPKGVNPIGVVDVAASKWLNINTFVEMNKRVGEWWVQNLKSYMF
jgi:hypothetical protein